MSYFIKLKNAPRAACQRWHDDRRNADASPAFGTNEKYHCPTHWLAITASHCFSCVFGGIRRLCRAKHALGLDRKISCYGVARYLAHRLVEREKAGSALNSLGPIVAQPYNVRDMFYVWIAGCVFGAMALFSVAMYLGKLQF